ILAAVAIFTFVQSWNNFLWPFVATTDPSLLTVPVGLGTVPGAHGIPYAQQMAAAVLGDAPLLAVFLPSPRQARRGVAAGGPTGAPRAPPTPPRGAGHGTPTGAPRARRGAARPDPDRGRRPGRRRPRPGGTAAGRRRPGARPRPGRRRPRRGLVRLR